MPIVKPIIVDEATNRRLWTAAECCDHTGVKPASWRSYVARSSAPAAVGVLDARTPLWDAEQVIAWQLSRPGKPGRPTAAADT